MPRHPLRPLILTLCVLAPLAMPSEAEARAFLVSASPAPNQTLNRPPEEVRLTFNTPLVPDTASVTVVDAVGVHVDRANAHVLSGDAAVLAVSLPSLEEGLYTVTYTVTDAQTETTTSDSYQFALEYPEPQVRLTAPPNGAGFEVNSVRVEVDTGNFDLEFWGYRWRLYLDGVPVFTSRQPTAFLRNLEPGIHELRVVLVDPDDNEVHDTRSTSYIAVGTPNPEEAEIAAAARAPGDPGLTLTPLQGVVLGIVVVVALGVGALLGSRRLSNSD